MSKHFLKGIIFDLDGTLLDSIHDIAAAMNVVLGQNGLPTHTLDEYRTFIGDGVAMLVRRSIAPVTEEAVFEKVRAEYARQYSSHADVLTRPFEGIEDSLKQLKTAYTLAVLSNKGDKDVKKLAVQYFGDAFACAYGQFGDYQVKPSPDLVYVIKDALGLRTEDCLFVGDSPMDIETAHNAGIRCVAVTWGYRDREVLAQAGADFICDDPTDLSDVIREAHPTKGFTYDLTDSAMRKELLRARSLVQKLNKVNVLDDKKKHKVMRELFGTLGEKADLNTPFACDFGSHIHIGKNFFCNYGCTFLDIAEIRIGDNVLMGPNVGLFTAGHPIDPQGRLDNIGTGNPIVIGNGVWIGGNVSVLAGVKIGDNAVIGAGSVVTHDIPANCVAAGNPARVIRMLAAER